MTEVLRKSVYEEALELVGGEIDPEIKQTYLSPQEQLLAQALENVEIAERRLRELQRLIDDKDISATRTNASPRL